ncbi:conserved hypothetical protein, partial [Ricinus communis]
GSCCGRAAEESLIVLRRQRRGAGVDRLGQRPHIQHRLFQIRRRRIAGQAQRVGDDFHRLQRRRQAHLQEGRQVHARRTLHRQRRKHKRRHGLQRVHRHPC